MRPSNKPRFFRLKWYEYSLTVQGVTALHRFFFPQKQTLSSWELAQQGNNWKLQWLQKPEALVWLREGLEKEGRAVQGILQMGKKHGFPVLLVVYPYPVMMARSQLENEHTKFWKEFAERNGTNLVDLATQFVEKETPPEETYRKYFISGDIHWNNGGNRLVAKALLPSIIEKMASASGREASKQ